MTRTSNLNILNELKATLLSSLILYLDGNVKNMIFSLHLFERFDGGRYELSNDFRWYKVIFFEYMPQKNFSKQWIIDLNSHFVLYLDENINNTIFCLHLFGRFDGGRYDLSNDFRWYATIFFDYLPWKYFLKQWIIDLNSHFASAYACYPN